MKDFRQISLGLGFSSRLSSQCFKKNINYHFNIIFGLKKITLAVSSSVLPAVFNSPKPTIDRAIWLFFLSSPPADICS